MKVILYIQFLYFEGRSSSVPPPCNRRTESSHKRVKQYTDKLLSIQGTKYRNQQEDHQQNRSQNHRGSPSKSCDLAPIPEERHSMLLEHETSLSGLSDVKMRNERLRDEFFKDFLPSPPKSQYSQNSLKRKKEAISANLNAMLESKQTAVSETKQLTPVNPLLSRTPSRSRSASPMTFTSSVKVQYKPRICPDSQLLVQNCDSCGNELSFDLSRSKSATAVLNASNGIFHATPYEEPDEEIPPPRPPLPMNYVDEQQSKYFLSLPRDWHSLARSASFSTMLYS